jgi:hypothetical protein
VDRVHVVRTAAPKGDAVRAQDPLASWNDGTAKKAIVDLVTATTPREASGH